MKKAGILLALLLLLTGCGGREAFETVEDVYAPQTETAKKLTLTLPDDAAVTTLSGSGGTLYLCDGFTVAVETHAGGDLNRTIKNITGYARDRLTVIRRDKDGITAYRCVWTSAGEGGDQVGRCLILDDGAFHYAVTVMADAADSTEIEEAARALFASVILRTD